MNVVITGTSRGIGRELVVKARARGDRVLAIQRKAESIDGAQTLALDVTDAEAGPRVAAALADWPHVDVLINDAGVYRQGVAVEDFIESFRVNSVAPFVITKATLPWLRKSKSPRAVHVTSKMGSIADNTGGGAYAYRASKTALNMINASLAVDEKWLTTIVIHPGWVQTDMGGGNAPTSIDESTNGIWVVIDRLTAEQTGGFLDFRGERLPW